MPGSRYYTHSYALIIGINTYQDHRFVALGQAEADAAALASVLAAPPYDFQVTTLLGAQATRQNILAELFKLRNTREQDRIVVYFAGHGYTLTDRFKKETGFLAAADTVAEQDFTALELEEVTQLIRHAPARHIAFIFDACFSGQALGLTRAVAADVAAEKFLERRAYQVLSAGAGDQTVADYHSMTSQLVSELQTRMADSDGLITFSELGLRIQQAISSDTGMTQIPQWGHLTGSQGGDLVFYVEAGPHVPTDIDEALDSSRLAIRSAALNDLLSLAQGDDRAMAEAATKRLAAVAANDPDASLRETARNALNNFMGEARAAELIAAEVQPPYAAIPGAQPGFADQLRLTGLRTKAALRRVPGWGWGMAGAALIAAVFLIVLAVRRSGGEVANLEGATPAPSGEPGAPTTEGPGIVPDSGEITRNYQWTPRIETVDGVRMAMVPAGCFNMGTNSGDPDEQPVTEICFDEPFWIDLTEVTIAAYMDSGSNQHPMERVDWFEAKAYCAQRGARLPTEAEWEYAARGPSGFRWPWGNYFNEDLVVWSVAEARQVGTFPDNASWVGALDMAGSVYEWVHSTYTPYPYHADDGREAEEGSANRVLRGGSWATTKETSLRGSFRFSTAPDNNYNGIGLRCARDN